MNRFISETSICVGEPHHRGPDDAIGELLDLQREFCAGELEVDALLDVDDESELALGDILHDGNGTGTHRKLLRLANADGVADVVAVDFLAELILVARDRPGGPSPVRFRGPEHFLLR